MADCVVLTQQGGLPCGALGGVLSAIHGGDAVSVSASKARLQIRKRNHQGHVAGRRGQEAHFKIEALRIFVNGVNDHAAYAKFQSVIQRGDARIESAEFMRLGKQCWRLQRHGCCHSGFACIVARSFSLGWGGRSSISRNCS